MRARIDALAEVPEIWVRCVKRWQRWNARCKRVLNGLSVPGPNEEYFIYQTLLGAWPLDPGEMETFVERLQNVLVKSWREAKLYTSWNNPDKDYEAAVAEFVATILTPVAENHFLPDFVKFQHRIAASGACLSLAQTLVRLVSPGVPDIYQGAELWELSMVDPDNRRPVDFAKAPSPFGGPGRSPWSRSLEELAIRLREAIRHPTNAWTSGASIRMSFGPGSTSRWRPSDIMPHT